MGSRGRVARALVPCSVFAARTYLNIFLAAALWILVPVLFGWQPLLITSGSMSPAIEPGDIVVTSPQGDAVLPQGAVITYHDPGGADRVVTHRVIGYTEGGEYRTKGDANPTPDSSPVPQDAILGFARLLVPFVTRPIIWARDGQLLQVAAWFAATLLAIYAATRRSAQGTRTRRLRRSRPVAPSPASAAASTPVVFAATAPAVSPAGVVPAPLGPLWTAGVPHRRWTAGFVRRATIAFALLLASSVAVAPAVSVLAGTTENSGNSWQAVDLAAPTDVTATPGCSGTTTTVELTWTATSSSPADGYAIYRSTIDEGPTKIATIAGTSTTSYVDDTVATGSYTYTLTTTLDSWSSEHSVEVSALVNSC